MLPKRLPIVILLATALVFIQSYNVVAQCTLKAFSGTGTTICNGSSATLGGTPLETGGASSSFKFKWQPINDSTHQKPVVSPTVTTTYTLTVIDSGCIAKDSIVITVSNVKANAGKSFSLCQNDSIFLHGKASGGVSPYSYYWTTPGQAPTTVRHQTRDTTWVIGYITTTGVFTINFKVTDAKGCVSVDSIKDTVKAIPLVSVTSVPNPAEYCNTGTSSAKAVLTAHNATSYIWTPNSSITATTGATVTVNPTVYSSTYVVYGFLASTGCSNSANIGVTVDPLPSPFVTTSNLTICRGSSITLTPTGATNYTWSASTSLTTTTGFKAIANPTVTTTYTLTGTDNNGCSATAPVTVTVIQPPVVTVVGDSSIFCYGTKVKLQAHGAGSYSWSPSTGLSSTIDSVVTASPVSTTTYIVTGKSAKCTLYGYDTLVINIKPTSASVTRSVPSICPGQTYDTLTAINLTSVTWSPSSALSKTTGDTVLASPSTTTIYTVTGTDTGHCVLHFPVTVTSNPLPTVTSNSSTICYGFTTSLTATGATYYSWSPTLGLSSATSSTTSANPTVTTTYIVTGINTYGCTDTGKSVVTVNTLPVINAITANYTICANQSTTLSTTSQSNTTYTWSPATGLSATTGSSVTANPPTTTIYTLTATNAYNCTSTDTVIVNVNPIPTITLNAKNGSFCRGFGRILVLTGTSVSYSFSPAPNGNNATYSRDTLTPPTTTTYTITGYTNKGCHTNVYDTITIYQLPTVVAGSDTSICNYTNVQFKKESPTGGTWSGTGVNATGLFNSLSLPSGSYHLTYTYKDAHNCSNYDTLTAFVTDSMKVHPGTGFAICKNAGVQTLSATPAGGKWTGNGISGNTFDPGNAPLGLNILTYTFTNGVCTTHDTIHITVKAVPLISYTPNLPCSKSAIYTLNGYTPTGGTWTGTGVIDSINGKISPSSLGAGVFYVKYHYTNITNQCHIDTSLQVLVKKSPTATFTADSLICTNSSVTIHNYSTSASGFNWDWVSGNSTAITPNVKFTATGFKTLTLIATDSNFCYDTASSQIHVITLPNVSFTASTLLGCGTFNDVFVNNTIDPYATSFSWNAGNGTTGTKDTLNVTYNSTGKDSSYTVTLKVNSFCGAAYKYDTVSAKVKPVANFAISYPGQCAPLHATFTNTSYRADTLTLSNSTWFTHTLPYYRTFLSGNYKDTTYRIYLLAKNLCGQDTISKLLDVYQRTIFDKWTLSDSIACTQLTVNFYDSSLGQTYYEWGTGEGTISNTNPFGFTYTKSGTYKSYLYQHNNCTFDTVYTTVHILPRPISNFTPNPDTTCLNENIVFTNTSTGLTTYKWYWGDGDSTNTTNGTHSYNSVTSYSVELKGTGTNKNCSADTTINITIYPKATETISANDSTGCSPLTIAFTNKSTYAKTYYWDFADGSTSTSKNPNHTFSAIGSYKVMCVAANPYGCNDTAYLNIYVKPKPKAVFTISSVQSCTRPDTITTTNSSTNAYKYSWSFGNGKTSTANTPTIIYTYASTFTIKLVAIDNNCSDTSTKTFSSYVLPSIVIHPGRNAICIGDTTSLLASGGTTYKWLPASTLSSSVGSSITAKPNTTIRYSITGTDSHGCSDTSSIRIIVNPLPTITTTPAFNATICNGKNVSITATGGISYIWSPSTSLSSTTASKVTAGPVSSLTYTVTGTDANGCSDTATVKVKVNPLPNVAISPSTYTAICLGLSQTLTASGAKTYSWAPGSSTATSVSENPTTTTVYTLTGTDANGCINTDTQKIVVYPLPVITATAVKTAICFDSTTSITASGAVSYLWRTQGSLSSATLATVSAYPKTTTTYTVVGKDAHNCVDSTSITIKVNPLPVVYITPTGATGICPGKNITLKDSGTASSFSWMPGSYSTTSITVSPSVTTIYTLTGTDFNGCINHDTQTVTVYVPPVVTLSATSNVFCYGKNTTISASGALNYTWTPTSTLSASTGSSVVATPTVTTVYSVTGADIHNCIDTTSIHITVNQLPTISLSPTGDTLCVGQSKTISAGGASTYTWSPSTGLSSTTASLVSANPTATVTYTISGTDINGCVNKDSIFVLVHPLPTVGISALQNYICLGHPITLGGTGASTYAWSPASGLSASTGSFVSASPSTATRYTLTGTDNYNCSDTISIYLAVYPAKIYLNKYTSAVCKGDTVDLAAFNAVGFSWQPAATLNSSSGNYVVAKPNTTTTYTVIGTDAHGCHDTATTTVNILQTPVYVNDTAGACIYTTTNGVASGSGIISYNWLPTTGIIGSTTTKTVTFNVLYNTSYMVIGTDANGCKDTAYCHVVAYPKPSVNFSFAPATGCAPLNVTFTNHSHGYQTMEWFAGDGSIYGDSSPVITYNAPGSWTPKAIAISSHGCADTFSSSKPIVIGIRPHAEFTYQQNTTPIITYAVAFANKSTNAVNYEWHFGDNSSDASSNPTHTYASANTYQVLLIAFNSSCADSSIQEVTLELFTSLYVPNALAPDKGSGQQKYFLPKGENLATYHLQIFDKWGKLLWETDKLTSKGEPAEPWDGTTDQGIAPQDIYVWRIDATFKDGSSWKGMRQQNGEIKTVGTISLIH